MASTASTIATRIGTYRSMTRRPLSSGRALRNAGTLPRITSSSGGKARAQEVPVGLAQEQPQLRRGEVACEPRIGSLSQVVCWWSVVQPAAGQRDEGVVEAGLLDPQVDGDDLVAGQDRR